MISNYEVFRLSDGGLYVRLGDRSGYFIKPEDSQKFLEVHKLTPPPTIRDMRLN